MTSSDGLAPDEWVRQVATLRKSLASNDHSDTSAAEMHHRLGRALDVIGRHDGYEPLWLLDLPEWVAQALTDAAGYHYVRASQLEAKQARQQAPAPPD